jgi:hypothetical protein
VRSSESALSLTAIESEALELWGDSSPIDAFRKQPFAYGATNTENDSNSGTGSASANIHGLGNLSTLTLINGRRSGGNSASGFQHGGFADLGRAEVTAAEYLGLGATLKTVAAPLDEVPPDTLWAELAELIDAYAMRSTGYTAQVAPGTEKFDGDYIHLSRAGEWDLSDAASPQDVGPKDAGPGEGDP